MGWRGLEAAAVSYLSSQQTQSGLLLRPGSEILCSFWGFGRGAVVPRCSEFTVATLVAFWEAFRITALLDRSCCDSQGKALYMSDVVITGDFVHLRMCRSKLDQRGLGQMVTLCWSSDVRVCPAWALTLWMQQLGD